MPIALALLIAPTLVLGAQSLMYALTPALCAAQAGAWLHAVAGVVVVVCSAAAAGAAHAMRQANAERAFLAGVAAGVGVLSTLTAIALWIPAWVLDPCLG